MGVGEKLKSLRQRRLRGLASQIRLGRWLGPWASADAIPTDVVRTERVLDATADRPALKTWVYRPEGRAVIGSYLVAQGLHYEGPADPRLDRFLRSLAHGGYEVWAPFLPDLLSLRVRASVVEDFGRALDAMLDAGAPPTGTRPGVFSISFGSLPALRVASDARWRDKVGGLMCFGGYADFREVVRFSLRPPAGVEHDPLNRPVVMMNLTPYMPDLPAELDEVEAAWTRYVHRTWGRPEMRVDGRYLEVAHEEGHTLRGDARALFEEGIGLRDGAYERCMAALDEGRADAVFMDPRPHMAGLRAPVFLVHGMDDDVIPWQQVDLLHEALPLTLERERFVTGLYAHTGKSGPNVGALAREGVTLLKMLAAVDDCARRPA